MARKVRGRCAEWSFHTSENGNEYINCRFVLTFTPDGSDVGESRYWRGMFIPSQQTRTMESLSHCGWDTGDVADMDLTRNEVELELDYEDYTDRETGEVKSTERVRWVNRIVANLKPGMDAAAFAAFAAKMRGPALAHQQNYGQKRGTPTAAPQQPAHKPLANDASRAYRTQQHLPDASFAGQDSPPNDNDAPY